MSNRKPDGLYWHSGETDAHIQMKLEICKYLKQINHEFYTEAILIDGFRADIVDIDAGIIYEVTDSESPESIEKKRLAYPLEIRAVAANQSFKPELIM